MGINSNLEAGGHELHVQTEDLGLEQACIVTHVFAEDGQVLWVARFDYSRHLGGANLRMSLPKVMHAHHLAVIQRVQRVLRGHEAEIDEWFRASGAPMDSIPPALVRPSQVVSKGPDSPVECAGRAGEVSYPARVRDHDRRLAAAASDEGFSLYRRGDLEGALLCWSRAVELDPKNRGYRVNLARLSALLERPPRT
jgi:hypothetical protein